MLHALPGCLVAVADAVALDVPECMEQLQRLSEHSLLRVTMLLADAYRRPAAGSSRGEALETLAASYTIKAALDFRKQTECTICFQLARDEQEAARAVANTVTKVLTAGTRALDKNTAKSVLCEANALL
jgi:hypothetical protein